jgi:DNA topoisomerase-6 subunit B
LQKAVKEIFPSMYKLTDGTKIGIWMHLCSTHIPYKTAGKEYISPDYEEINKQIGNALKDCLRSVRDFMSKRIHEEQAQKRKSIFDIYLPIISSSLSVLSEKTEGEVLEMLRSVI